MIHLDGMIKERVLATAILLLVALRPADGPAAADVPPAVVRQPTTPPGLSREAPPGSALSAPGPAGELRRDRASLTTDERIGPPPAPPPAGESGDGPATSGPDERLLWALFNSGELQRLDQVLGQWRQAYPQWQPPQDLLWYREQRGLRLRQGEAAAPQAAARDRQRKRLRLAQGRLEAALNSEQPAAIATAIHREGGLFSCAQPAHLQALLPLYRFTHSRQETLDLLRRLLTAPGYKGEEQRFALLLGAQAHLGAEEYEQLLAAGLPLLHNDQHRTSLAEARYQRYTLALAETLASTPESARVQRLLSPIAAQIRASRDVGVAQTLGWYFRNGNQAAVARGWFELAAAGAVPGSPAHTEALFGKALTLRDQGDGEAALALARQHRHADSRMRELYEELVSKKIDTLVQAGSLDAALALAKENEGHAPGLRRRSGDLLLTLAWRDYRAGHYGTSRERAQQARQRLESDVGADTVLAWVSYGEQRYQQALEQFAALYQRTGDPDLVRGIVASRLGLGVNHEELGGLAAQSPPDLAAEIAAIVRRDLYLKKEFPAAAVGLGEVHAGQTGEGGGGTAPATTVVGKEGTASTLPGLPVAAPSSALPEEGDRFATLRDIDSPTLGTLLLYRERQGEPGTTALQTVTLPSAEARLFLRGRDEVRLVAHRFRLVSGRLDLWERPVGSAGVFQGGERTLASTPEIALENGTAVQLEWERSGWWHPTFGIGATPANGAESPALTFHGGVRKHTASGSWEVEAFSRPVTDSLLAFTGWEDPYTGVSWGRVVESGANSSLYHTLSGPWSMSGELQASAFTGQGVDANTRWLGAASLGYDLGLDRFDYFTVGPGVRYEHYRYNRSHFTLGHGGYFSPDRFLTLGLQTDFLSTEGRGFMVRGHGTLGYQAIANAAAELFPGQESLAGREILLASGERLARYQGDSPSGLSYGAECTGVWLIAPHWQLDTALGLRQTSDYQEYFAGVGIRYSFRPRQGLFSSDLPAVFAEVFR